MGYDGGIGPGCVSFRHSSWGGYVASADGDPETRGSVIRAKDITFPSSAEPCPPLT